MKRYLLLIVFLFLTIELSAQWETDQKLSTYETNAITSSNNCPCIAVRGNEVHVIWWDYSGGIYYKSSSDEGINWDPVVRLPIISNYVDFPSIAVVGNNIHIAYREYG